MAQGNGAFLQLWYGFSEKDLFVRLDPAKGADLRGELRILVARPSADSTLRMALKPGGECPVTDEHGAVCGTGVCGAIVELSISLPALSVAPKDQIGMLVRLMRDEVEVDRLPRYGELTLVVPDKGFERAHWSV